MQLRTLPSNNNYMAHQSELNWNMRGQLLCWLIQVHNRFRMLPETLYLTFNIIDRFLALKEVSIDKLQLVGVVALFIASKYEEVMTPPISDFVYMVDNAYSADIIIQAEQCILSALEFQLGYPGPFNFVRRLSGVDGFNSTMRNLAKYFLELSALSPRFVNCPVSFMSACAMFLARKVISDGSWVSAFLLYSKWLVQFTPQLNIHLLIIKHHRQMNTSQPADILRRSYAIQCMQFWKTCAVLVQCRKLDMSLRLCLKSTHTIS